MSWKFSKNLKIFQKSENFLKIWKFSKNLKIGKFSNFSTMVRREVGREVVSDRVTYWAVWGQLKWQISVMNIFHPPIVAKYISTVGHLREPVELDSFGWQHNGGGEWGGGEGGGGEEGSDTPAFRLTGHGTLPPSCSCNPVTLCSAASTHTPPF